MATDSFEVNVVADAAGNGEGYTPPLDSWFLYHVRFVEDADDPVAVAESESNYIIQVVDEETGLVLLSITSIVNNQVYPVTVASVRAFGSAVDDWQRWQTRGRIKVTISKAVADNTFTAFIHRTTDDARMDIY